MDELVSHLALRLYAAALDNQGWNETLAEVAHGFHADMAMLMLIDVEADRPRRAGMQAAHNIAPDALAEYGRHLVALDPWVRYGVTRMPPMQATRLDTVIPAESFVDTAPFRHFTRHGIPARHILTARFDPTEDGVTGAISLLRRGESGGFAADTEPALQALLPHLRRAAGAHARLHGAGVAMAHAMEALGQAVAVLDNAARPLAMNPPFRALLADGWFVQRHGAVAPAETARAPRFAAIVAACAAPGTAPPPARRRRGGAAASAARLRAGGAHPAAGIAAARRTAGGARSRARQAPASGNAARGVRPQRGRGPARARPGRGPDLGPARRKARHQPGHRQDPAGGPVRQDRHRPPGGPGGRADAAGRLNGAPGTGPSCAARFPCLRPTITPK